MLLDTLGGGCHWRTSLQVGDGVFGWSGLRFVTAEVGLVLGPTHDALTRLYRTLDGGRTWRTLPLPR